MIKKTAKFCAVTPFAGAKALITGDGRPFIQGAVLGALALVLITGAQQEVKSMVPITAETLELMVTAARDGESIFDGRIDIMPLGLDEDVIPEFVPPIPQRKPDGYTRAERTAMNNLFETME